MIVNVIREGVVEGLDNLSMGSSAKAGALSGHGRFHKGGERVGAEKRHRW